MKRVFSTVLLTFGWVVLVTFIGSAHAGVGVDPDPNLSNPNSSESSPFAIAPVRAAWTRRGNCSATFTARFGTFAVYDIAGDRMVLFGGYNAGLLRDTWTLELAGGPAWHRIAPAGTPPAARVWHGEVYDPVR